MQGIEILTAQGAPDAARAGALVEAALSRGLIMLSGGVNQNVISLTPPFVIAEDEIDFALQVLKELGN